MPDSRDQSSKSDQAEFDQFAARYDEDLHHALKVTGEDKYFFCKGRLAWLAEWMRTERKATSEILDFGCGTGTATPFLFDQFAVQRTLGVDVSDASLQIASKNHGSECSEFHRIDVPEKNSFDLAFCNGVFHHIDPDERQEALDYVFRSLRPGGVFALFENNPWNPATRYVMSRTSFDRDAITLNPLEARRRLTDAGFELRSTRFLFIFPALFGFLRVLEPALSRLPFGAQYVVVGSKPSA